MVSPTQLCWRYHSLPLRQRYVVVCSLSSSPIKAYLKLNSPRYLRGTICLTLIQKRKCTRVARAMTHDDVIKSKHFPRYWTFVWGIHRSPVSSPHKGQWRGAWMVSLICAWINPWVNNGEAGDLRRHRAHYDISVMVYTWCKLYMPSTKTPINSINIQIYQSQLYRCRLTTSWCHGLFFACINMFLCFLK